MYIALGQDTMKQRRAKIRKLTDRPRLATSNHIKTIDRALELAGQELGLEFCRNWQELEALNLLDLVSTGCEGGAKPDFAALRQKPSPTCLITSHDQHQTQVLGGAWCESPAGIRLTMVSVFDIYHRLWNCLKAAEARAGLTPMFYAATTIYNFAYGPWESSAWFHQLLMEAADVGSTLDPDGPLMMLFWQRILGDKRRSRDSCDLEGLSAREARAEHLKTLQARGAFDIRNTKVKPSVWFSFHKAHEQWDPHVSTRAMVLTSMCMRNQWLRDLEDLQKPTGVKIEVVGGGKKGAMNAAKAKIAQLRDAGGHTCKLVCRLASDRDVLSGIRLLAEGSRCMYSWYSTLYKDLKAPERCAAHAQGWASSSWLEPLKETLRSRGNLAALEHCGFQVRFQMSLLRGMSPQAPAVVYQDNLAKTLGTFTWEIVAEVSSHMMWWSGYYPGRFVLLTSKDHRIVKQTMRQFQVDCEAYWFAKATTLEFKQASVP